MKYTDYPKDEHPVTRLREAGREALSNTELLAVALFINDADTARELSSAVSKAGGLQKLHKSQVIEIKGLGERYAEAIEAIAELARREAKKPSFEDRRSITSPQDIFDELSWEMSVLDHEELWVIQLDTRNRLIGKTKLYVGSLNASMVRVGECFTEALRMKAAAIILAHNHPSGDPKPSPEDVTLTRSVVQAGKLLDIAVLDHVIIGSPNCVSLKEKGLGF